MADEETFLAQLPKDALARSQAARDSDDPILSLSDDAWVEAFQRDRKDIQSQAQPFQDILDRSKGIGSKERY